MRRTLRQLGWCAVLAPACAQSIEVHWAISAHSAAVEVTGIPPAERQEVSARSSKDPAWGKLFAVYAEQSSAVGDMPPMAGEWRIAGDRLRFVPKYPLARGVRYRAEFRSASAAPVRSYFELPAETAGPSTRVVQVYPTADDLPENQLKFYVQFSAPMSRGDVYEHIHLRDASGRALELAFLELEEELWDPSMTRLTLLIDPGRIKRGVRPLEEIGPVFEAGKSYALTIGPGCRDAAGRPLLAGFEKKIRAVPADRTPPDPKKWKLFPPGAGTRAPLAIEFDEPMDQALALRLIGVAPGKAGATACAGEASLGPQERRWQFVPETPWARGAHRLTVATTIEDLAGNNVGKAFDVDQFERVNRSIARENVELAFEVKE